MKTNKKRAISAVLLLVLGSGCSLFKSSEDDNQGKIIPAQGGAGSSGGGAAGAGGIAAGGAPTGGAGGVAAANCEGLNGPLMVELQSPKGVSYCIDRTEVTQADYALFLKQATSVPGSEDSRCQYNTTYAPLDNPIDTIEPKDCMDSFNPTTTPKHPVVCIDWCDAQAYCKWAGKRLCGKIGGGSGSVSGKLEDPADPANDASVSQWFNACSQGGQTKYPYGSNYDLTACRADAKPDSGAWPPVLADVGTSPKCRGTNAPYSSILDLSGSVVEFTDECVSGYDYVCAARGGGKTSPASDLGCAFFGAVNLGQTFQYMGFRCCKDLP